MWTPEALLAVGIAVLGFTIGTIWLYRITRTEDDAAPWRFRDR
jgi:hypothetical protein